MTVPSGAVLLALAWCPCQPGKSIVWSISFISSVNENIPLMFLPLPDLAQMQINPFNSSPSALMELGGCDKWKMFISFLISQSPKVGPLPRVPWLGIHEKAKDSSDAWSCYHLHCLNWKPCFLFPASPQKLFPLSSEDFTAFKACSNILDHQVRSMGEVLQAIGLGEGGKIAWDWFPLPSWISWKCLSKWADAHRSVAACPAAAQCCTAVFIRFSSTFLRISEVCFPQLVLVSAGSSSHSWTHAGLKLFWCT